MKILHVSKKYPRAPGGDAVVVSNLAAQQQQAGHKVTIVTSNCAGIPAKPRIYKIGLTDTPANLDRITLRRLVSLGILLVRMFKILAKERPDIIHTHSVDMAFVVSFAARFFHIPLVHTFHIVTFYDPSQSALRRNSELWLARHAKPRHTTAPNMFDVSKLQNAGLAASLLPNGVDLGYWRKAARFAGRVRMYTFVAIGRLEPQKGFDCLVKAAALAADSGKEFRIIIVGDGSARAALERDIKLRRINHIVQLPGHKGQAYIRKLLGGADAMILPSRYETTPLTLLEAWAAGVPVISTAVGILRDIPRDFAAAHIVPVGDERALAAAMQDYMARPQTGRTLARHGRRQVAGYDWPVIARRAEALYGTSQ